MAEAKDRIGFDRPVDEWIRIAVESARLPGTPHGDPADRMLMASARVTGGRLATRDGAIIEYGAAGHMAVLDARP